MTYAQTLRYLDSFINFEKKTRFPYKKSFKLERIRDFLHTIGDPHDGLRCIHVAGTKGKGSTCMFIASILSEAGFRVGLYTSPHLSSVRERVRILPPRSSGVRRDGEDFSGMIAKRELTRLVVKMQPAIDAYSRDSLYGPLAFFEVYTALAFEYFKEKKVDFVVLETGLGGRLDATNVVEALVSCLSPISFDHMQKLGSTLAEIAYEKAGIIKPRRRPQEEGVVVSSPQYREALKVIKERCRQVRARLWLVGRDIRYETHGAAFTVQGVRATYPGLRTKLIGEHQVVNAAVAIGALEALAAYGVRVGLAQVRRGLFHAFWPGRCEVVARDPLVVLDGAQNADSCRIIKDAVRGNFRYRKSILVVGVSRDKDIPAICASLDTFADTIILTCSSNPRACPPQQLLHYFSNKNISLTHSIKEAYKAAYLRAGPKDLILVCGSLFVVGEFRELVRSAKK